MAGDFATEIDGEAVSDDGGMRPLTVVVLAAGKGTRMKSKLPKVMHCIAHRPMVAHVISAAEALSPRRILAVIGPEINSVADAVKPYPAVVQNQRLGTGHAVKVAVEALERAGSATGEEASTDGGEDVLILYGDTPLVTPATMRRLLAARAPDGGRAAVRVLGFRPADAAEYGRLILDRRGAVERIVEYRDADEGERAVGLCNSGIMAVDAGALPGLLRAIGNDNAKGEYYLTDIVAIARDKGLQVALAEAGEDEVLGVNSRSELAVAEAVVQKRLRNQVMAAGVTLIDPDSVYLSADIRFGTDIVVEPSVVFGPGVTVGDEVEIRSFSHIEGASIEAGATVGPFARLRPGAVVGERAHVGNFVEMKKARLGPGAKANHLTYLGDAEVGEGANIGAGTITCNYDGYGKYRTEIGAGAFIGSNSALVAPVSVGAGAIVGAGSTITNDVPDDALAIGRGEQTTVADGGRRFRERAARRAGKKMERS